MIPFSFYASTDVGRVRTNNEDNFIAEKLWDENHLLLSVIDGVGGYEGGEIAASICRDVICTFLKDNPGFDRLESVKQAVLEANNKIVEAKNGDPEHPAMSCVASTTLIDLETRTAYIAHVGDTRIYLYDNGTLRKVTHDHSPVGYREEVGELTEQEAMHHPQRNIIERALGDRTRMFEEEDFLDASQVSLPPDGKLLLCSDGLTDLVTSAEISTILSSVLTTEEKVNALIAKALDKGGKDNVTVVLLELAGVREPEVAGPAKTPEPAPTQPRKSGHKGLLWLAVGLLAGLAAGGSAGFFAGRRPPEEKIHALGITLTEMRDAATVLNDELTECHRKDSLLLDASQKQASQPVKKRR